MDIYNPVYPGLYYFDTFTFTTLGTSGHRGPDSTKTYANAPWREGDFSIVEGQQQWTVPATGTYHIEAAGAYGATPGRVVSGDVDLNEGQVVSLLVGQQPNPLVANVADNVTVGGGGGTFVTVDGKPLIVASGGDGGVYSTGYLRSELVPQNYQFRVSMSADGNIYAAAEINLITYQFSLTIYRYLSGVWTLEFTESVPGFITTVGLSGNGKTVAIPTSDSITVYEYIDNIWQNPRYITNIDWYYFSPLDISYDGNTIVAFIEDIAQNWHLYVFTKNQNLTWNTEELSAPINFTFTVYQLSSCAISRDGMRIFAAADDIYTYPRTTNVWSYSRTNDTWSLPEFYADLGALRVESASVSYDGQFVALYLGNLYTSPYEGYLYVYENGTLTKNITYPWVVQQYPAGAAQISYDGSLILLTFITGKVLVTPSTQITIFDDASGFPVPAGCMDSTASRIVSPYYDAVNPITYFFEVGGSGQPGSFLPSGTGLGISGSGYLTDGQVSNPYFGFLKPQAYVDGGFGNMYWYGHKGEGGFGGGQSPLNKQADLTSVIGYNQFRPTIPLVSGGLSGMAISEDANTFLASFFTGNYWIANVYTYNGTSWVSTNLYTTTGEGQTLAMSGDGIVWLINADVWRNGTFETQLQSFINAGLGTNFTDISRDGNTVAIITYGDGGGFDTTVRLIVYSYSGYWTPNTLFTTNPYPEYANYSCVMSADGNTIAMSYSVSAYGFVNVYRRVDGTWSGPDQIYYETHSSRNSIVLNVNSNGSTITLLAGNNYQYSNGVLSRVDYRTYSVAFSRTDPNLYAWVDFTKVYVPSISLEVDVQVDPAGIDFMRMGSNVLAMTKILTPHAIVFLDMYDPTTTCTANTSVDHGYPHNYQVQITGTQYFNGTWDIVTTSSNTFTFQAFGGPTVTSGYVSGTTTGISGGGGYTGSAGDGVSGATCYADPAVRNFTDLGAASNSAGYVTVSLIDPPPLNQTWSWSPNFVDTTLRGPWQNVNWSDELQQFLSTSGTSDDGLIWNNATTLLGLFTGRYPTNPVYCTAYSPTLGIYVGIGYDFTVLQIFFKYSYDKVNWINSYQINSAGFKVIWVHEFNLFIATTQYEAYSSSDGINWTIRYTASGFSSFNETLVYASSIHRIVTSIAYTDDGINWTQFSIPYYIYSIAWSPSLSRFIATTSLNSCQYSSDGITWSSTGVDLPSASWVPTIWSDQNSLFSILSSTQAAYSSDGIHWRVTGHETITVREIAFSPTNGVYVAAGELSEGYLISIGGIYWVKPVPVEPITRVAAWAPDKGIILMSDVASYNSSDGISWTLAVTKNFFNIVYSDGLGMFVGTEYPQGNVYYSYDGSNFVDSNFAFSTSTYDKKRITWSRELGMFSGKAYSRDGINWTFSSINALSVAWCPEQARFVALTSTNSYYSSDGINWSLGSSLGITIGSATQIAWSHLLQRFAVVCNTGGGDPSNDIILYSDNGTNWLQTTSNPFSYARTTMIWIPELQLFMTNGAYSYDGINWIYPSIPLFSPVVWTPELKKIVCEAGYSEVTKTF